MARKPISVKIKSRNVEKAFREFGEDAKDGIAKTLNVLAGRARKDVKESLSDYFTLRTPDSRNGAWHNPASKWHLQAEVGTPREYLADHAVGVKRRAKGKRIAVAQVGAQAPRKTIKDKVAKTARPSAIFAKDALLPPGKRRLFLAPTKSGKTGIWRKMGRIRKGVVSDAGGVKLMYVLAKVVRIKKDWPLGEIVNKSMDRRFETALREGIVVSLKRAWKRNHRAKA